MAISLSSILGRIPNRPALVGGWIDQPLVSRSTHKPPGSSTRANGAGVNQPRASEAPPWGRRPRKHIAP